MLTLEDVKNDERIRVYITKANENLGALGYTDHGERHSSITAERAREILLKLGYEEEVAELASIAGYLHDLGNVISRSFHAMAGALLVRPILSELGMPLKNLVEVLAAVGNHDEGEEGEPVSEVAAAVLIADKSDVNRSRVRTLKEIDFDIHDRVNYAVTDSQLEVDREAKIIRLRLNIDSEISDMVEYFEIFLSRMLASRRAAKVLSCEFDLDMVETKHEHEAAKQTK